MKNVHRVLLACGLGSVPVYVGCGRPLLAEPVNAEEFHGADGLGDVPHVHPPAAELDDALQHNSSSAALALVQASQQYRGQLTVVALGGSGHAATLLPEPANPRICTTHGRIRTKRCIHPSGASMMPQSQAIRPIPTA